MNMNFPFLRFLLDSSELMLRLQLVGIILFITFFAFYFFQKIVPQYLFSDDSLYAGFIYNAMGVVYSIVFAFITVLVWQSYNNVSVLANKEAGHLSNIYRMYSAFPESIDKAGKESLRRYVKTVVEDEWPLLKKDKFSTEAYKQLLSIEEGVINYQPTNLSQSNAHQQMLTLITEYAELRRSRVYSAQFALAPPAWLGLISSSFIFLLFACLFKMNSIQTHVILLTFLSFTVAGVIYFLTLYIHPFLGPMAIGPEPFQRLLDFAWTF